MWHVTSTETINLKASLKNEERAEKIGDIERGNDRKKERKRDKLRERAWERRKEWENARKTEIKGCFLQLKLKF